MKPEAAVEAALRDYADLLLRWTDRINLIADRDRATLWDRHVLDCLQLAPLLPEGDGPLVDLGSGAGLPGLVLAMATGRETHLVESDQRKAAFLREAARVLGLNQVRVHAARIEAATLPPAAVVTARALAALPILLGYAHRLLAPSGVAVFPKGRRADLELTEAAAAWTMQVERFPSRTDPDATIFRLRDIRPTSR